MKTFSQSLTHPSLQVKLVGAYFYSEQQKDDVVHEVLPL